MCGTCTVLVDGASVRSCLMLAVQADGATSSPSRPGHGAGVHPLQQAFCDAQGLQCGFCTPGMLADRGELLDRNPKPIEAEIREPRWRATSAAARATSTSSTRSRARASEAAP